MKGRGREKMIKMNMRIAKSGNYRVISSAITFNFCHRISMSTYSSPSLSLCLFPLSSFHLKTHFFISAIYPMINSLAMFPNENYLFTLAPLAPLICDEVGLSHLASCIVLLLLSLFFYLHGVSSPCLPFSLLFF